MSVKSESAYEPPKSELAEKIGVKKEGWKLLALWCTMVLLVCTYLSFIVAGNTTEFKSVSFMVGFIFGNVFGLPIIILTLSQIWKKHRNARSRVKAVLYPAYIVLFSQVGSFFKLVSEISKGAG